MSHNFPAKVLTRCLGSSLCPEQLLIGLIVAIDVWREWSLHAVPSCLTQVLAKVWVELTSLKVQDKVVKDEAATNKHEGPFLVFFGRNLDAKLAKCLKPTFEQPYHMLGTYSNLNSSLVK
jgi:hypothetical protein